MRKLFVIVVACVVVVLCGYAGYRGYKVWKAKHFVSLAQGFLATGDRRNAMLSAEQALRAQPNNLEATRVMAQLADSSRLPAALFWRGKVVDLAPSSLDDRVALAQTALVARDLMAATNALEGASAADKETFAYHSIAGVVAVAVNRRADAEAHFLAASRLEPQNPTPQLNLAILFLQGTNTLEFAAARKTLEGLAAKATNSTLRCQAMRELILDGMRRKRPETALALSKQLTLEPDSPFTDRIVRLEVLLETKDAGFGAALAAFQREAATDPGKISELAVWELAKRPPGEALAWLRGLPMTTQTNQPASLLVAEGLLASKDWNGLNSWLDKQNWGVLEFMRHAYLARALREQQLGDAAKTEWNQAVQLANGRKGTLNSLLELASGWNWRNEGEDLLWTLYNKYPAEKWTAPALSQALNADGRTRSLLQLYKEEIKRHPANLTAKNNVAILAMLLGEKDLKPFELAREVHEQIPTNSFFATTYAYSLQLQGRSKDALNVMQQLPPQALENPSTGGYMGIILKATGGRARAKLLLEKAAKAAVLPEERELFSATAAGI